jgi:hypothetical protein
MFFKKNVKNILFYQKTLLFFKKSFITQIFFYFAILYKNAEKENTQHI